MGCARRPALSASGAAIVLLGLAVTAVADPSGAPAGHVFSSQFARLDANHDGFIERAEVRRFEDFAQAFDEADENHDGKLDPEEFVKAEAIYQRIVATEFIDDSLITAKVKAAFLREPKLKSLDVSVETFRGYVLLSGFVDTASQRTKALQAAASVNGVVGIKDRMVVR